MEFTQIDELGLERTYYEITEIEMDNEEYVIYTDLLKDKENNKEFRLLVGKTDNGNVIRCDKETENKVIEKFSDLEDKYKDFVKELYK